MNSLKIFTIIFLTSSLVLFSCKKEDAKPDSDLDYTLGWNGTDDPDKIPSNLNFGNNGTFPSSFEMTDKFPPIGNQGNYGTCVAWAAGYNAKTAIEGIDQNFSSTDLSNPSNQISPRDLFTSIPDNLKGQGCNGTNFTTALDVLQQRGATTLDNAPYTQQMDCGQANQQSSWNQDAANHKIKYYRKTDVSIEAIKKEIHKNLPVVLGAKLADNFMNWNSSAVISSGSSFDNVGQHAYHAMVISGWDDNKGPNGALKIINSWGERWGDRGYIWVDYRYFIQEFNFGGNLFVMTNEKGSNEPPKNDPATKSVDLAPWVFTDYSTYSTSGIANERNIEFNLYNIGSTTAKATDNWSLYYLYYNAYNANDYGVLYYDEFNTTVARNTFDCPQPNHCIVNIDIPSGSGFAEEGWGEQSVNRTYYVPQSLTGYYYIVAFADASGSFDEEDENNNLFYTSGQWPKYFEFGYSESGDPEADHPARNFSFTNTDKFDFSKGESKYASVVHGDNPNTYSPTELQNFFSKEKKNGNLKEKLVEWHSSNSLPYPK